LPKLRRLITIIINLDSTVAAAAASAAGNVGDNKLDCDNRDNRAIFAGIIVTGRRRNTHTVKAAALICNIEKNLPLSF